ncbi:MAG: UvrD-helicase domain-containing protein, partial [Firmicutes bacterium]|nr:UvrD-helicase domain-containing protein [Bacillota bacterium]
MTTFTPAQQQAIDCNASNILVSAAAGSGKTAVLTERILRHIFDGVNIDNLLVVTFTESASAEMRERIAKKMQDAGLVAQIARLPMANISTIHSFCRKLVQEYFQV